MRRRPSPVRRCPGPRWPLRRPAVCAAMALHDDDTTTAGTVQVKADGDNSHADDEHGAREAAAREGALAGGRSVAAWIERTSKLALASTVASSA